MERAFIETKIIGSDDGLVSGLAWKFGVPDRVNDWIEPGAFKGAKLPVWPAAGFVDTEIRCLTELESWNAETKVQPRVQA